MRLVAEARKPGLRVGLMYRSFAVVVRDGELIGRGAQSIASWTETRWRTRSSKPSREAALSTGDWRLNDCELFVTRRALRHDRAGRVRGEQPGSGDSFSEADADPLGQAEFLLAVLRESRRQARDSWRLTDCTRLEVDEGVLRRGELEALVEGVLRRSSTGSRRQADSLSGFCSSHGRGDRVAEGCTTGTIVIVGQPRPTVQVRECPPCSRTSLHALRREMASRLRFCAARPRIASGDGTAQESQRPMSQGWDSSGRTKCTPRKRCVPEALAKANSESHPLRHSRNS